MSKSGKDSRDFETKIRKVGEFSEDRKHTKQKLRNLSRHVSNSWSDPEDDFDDDEDWMELESR